MKKEGSTGALREGEDSREVEESPEIGLMIERRTGDGKKEVDEDEEEEEEDGDAEAMDEVAEEPMNDPIIFISSLIKQKWKIY